MWLRKKGIFLPLLSVLCSVVTATSGAQQSHEPIGVTYPPAAKGGERPAKSPAPRTLTADEGLAVLGAALESRGHSDFRSDCSHLVHAIYERAGFPYSYANSATLYSGSDEFRRVARPQPGDLVVWPGHVGIAVNPAQRSFFSALRSGLGVDSYDSGYWRGRGHPHFLRYLTSEPATIRIALSDRESGLSATASRDSHPPIARSVGYIAGEAPETESDPAVTIIPSVPLLNSQRPNPTEVTAVLKQAFSETGQALRGQDVLKPSRPLMVFDQFSVARVRLQRDRGWAEVRLNGAFRLPREKTTSTKRAARQRWLLVRHDRNTWELLLPPEAIYLPSDVAVRMLVHQLAALTEETSGQLSTADEKVELSRLLNVLLEKPRGSGE
jgi:hypothetical protein